MSYQLCTKKKYSWFTSPIFNYWFFEHFVPEVRHYHENVLHIAPENVKARLLDRALANADAEKLVSADGKICTIFLPPNMSWISE